MKNKFHSKSCYKLYMYAKGLAEQVNQFIDKGYIVLDEEGHSFMKFSFEKEYPCIVQIYGNVTITRIGGCRDENNRVWIHGDLTKKDIKNMFQKILIYKPENRIKLKY